MPQYLISYMSLRHFPPTENGNQFRVINGWREFYHISVAQLYIGGIYGIRVSSIPDSPRATAGLARDLLACSIDPYSEDWPSIDVG